MTRLLAPDGLVHQREGGLAARFTSCEYYWGNRWNDDELTETDAPALTCLHCVMLQSRRAAYAAPTGSSTR